jgi:hypothetical protein
LVESGQAGVLLLVMHVVRRRPIAGTVCFFRVFVVMHCTPLRLIFPVASGIRFEWRRFKLQELPQPH